MSVPSESARPALTPGRLRALVIGVAVVSSLATHYVDRARAVFERRVTTEEMIEATRWLDQYYASQAGLQRPGGLCAGGQLDHAAVGVWLFEAYLHGRPGTTAEQARMRIIEQIERSDEWKSRH